MWAKAKYFGDNDSAARILEAVDPLKCKQLGRLVKGYDDKQWSLVRYSFMHDANFEKYSQDTKLKEKLLDPAFDGKEFVEASPTDCVWGIGFAQVDAPNDESKWLGQNLLGKVITQVRDEILNDTAGLNFSELNSEAFKNTLNSIVNDGSNLDEDEVSSSRAKNSRCWNKHKPYRLCMKQKI